MWAGASRPCREDALENGRKGVVVWGEEEKEGGRERKVRGGDSCFRSGAVEPT